MNKISASIRWTALRVIRLYQKTLSLDHGFLRHAVPSNGRCRYYPTCSEYGYQAVERFGLLRGGFLALRRVLRCHPYAKGGIDEVPKQ
ncbi:membrane protein insertion efficiency factor YidD [Patescibacteria group bacterium]|nr:membrane protein insertion efficiency factor YidD [Patescibacteria group bacterium]